MSTGWTGSDQSGEMGGSKVIEESGLDDGDPGGGVKDPAGGAVGDAGPRTVRPRGVGSDPGSLSDWAQKKIADMILTRELAGGDPVVEGRLINRLSVSRTPLREALLRLEGEGLLVKESGRSYMVRKVTPNEFFQSMKVRELVEAEAVGLAMARLPQAEVQAVRDLVHRLKDAPGTAEDYWDADNRVHELFCIHSGNAVLSKVVRELRVTTRLFEASSPFGRSQSDCLEHLEILDAALSGDARATKRAMVRHIRNLQRDVLESLTA